MHAMVVKLPVHQQAKYFAGARLLVLMQWGTCKPIIVIQFAFALCSPGLVIVSLGLLLKFFLGRRASYRNPMLIRNIFIIIHTLKRKQGKQ